MASRSPSFPIFALHIVGVLVFSLFFILASLLSGLLACEPVRRIPDYSLSFSTALFWPPLPVSFSPGFRFFNSCTSGLDNAFDAGVLPPPYPLTGLFRFFSALVLFFSGSFPPLVNREVSGSIPFKAIPRSLVPPSFSPCLNHRLLQFLGV